MGHLLFLHPSLRFLLVSLQIGHGHGGAAAWSWRPATVAFLEPAYLTKSPLSSKVQFKSYQSPRRPLILLGCQQWSFLCRSGFRQLSLGLLRELPWPPSVLFPQPVCPFFDDRTMSHACLSFPQSTSWHLSNHSLIMILLSKLSTHALLLGFTLFILLSTIGVVRKEEFTGDAMKQAQRKTQVRSFKCKRFHRI